MAGRRGFYSNIIVYDERRRYYYLWPQKNKPLLDDEIRDMGEGLLDQVRRATQSTYGDIAAVTATASRSGLNYPGQGASPAPTTSAFKVVQSSVTTTKNFKITGGSGLDHPAVLFAKGYYVFLTGDIEYNNQMLTPGTDIATAAAQDLPKTQTAIPVITTPGSNRVDIVYLHLHFEEVTAATGSDAGVYLDSSLRNPVVGTETANRLRAVVDIRVREGWSKAVDKNIFWDNEFLGTVGSDTDPTGADYKIPLAAIRRTLSVDTILNADIVDLLALYDKRVLSLEELSFRMSHGGYTQGDVDERSLAGFSAQWPQAVIDEGAFATGLNLGLGSEALNTNAVTPRILDNSGKFFMQGVHVGHYTGINGYETGAAGLGDGEVIVNDVSTQSIYVGHGLSGVPGARDYYNKIDVVMRGASGQVAVRAVNYDGHTGSQVEYLGAVDGVTALNYRTMDARGRMGVNTQTPGWSGPSSEWTTERYNEGLFGATGVNIASDINASQRVTKHLFVDKDSYVGGDTFGHSHRIPENITQSTPAMFGFTGVPQVSPIAGQAAALLVKRGIAVIGESGMSGYGFTGAVAGQYECYDVQGRRMFTIGDLGAEFDRRVKTLFGMDARPAYMSNQSLLELPFSMGGITGGDVVSYEIQLSEGQLVTGMQTISTYGLTGVWELATGIMGNPGFQNGYTRTYTYDDVFIDEFGTPIITVKTGTAYGFQVVEDPAGVPFGSEDNGRVILKDMPESPTEVELGSINKFLVNRPGVGYTGIYMTFERIHCFGSSDFGGDVMGVKFAKLDLGEGAEGWLFNGDVYFNNTGYLNRVTFSPNVFFRNDVYAYGTIYADQMVFNFANVSNLNITSNLAVQKHAVFYGDIAVGIDADVDRDAVKVKWPDTLVYVKGGQVGETLRLVSTDATNVKVGELYLGPKGQPKVSVRLGGSVKEDSDRLGIHLIDDRGSSYTQDPARVNDTFYFDSSDGRGNYRNVNVSVLGNLSVSNALSVSYLAVGPGATVNTLYALSVAGKMRVDDVLEVKALRFIGQESPEGQSTIDEPGNVSVISNGQEVYNNDPIPNILREKKVTVVETVFLSNSGKLGPGLIGLDPYYNAALGVTGNITAKWAHDTLTYTEDQINYLQSTSDPGYADDVVDTTLIGSTNTEYTRTAFNRITLASLGILHATWTGWLYDPDGGVTEVLQGYYFDSPYFRNKTKGTTIDWFPGGNRSGAINLLARVRVDLTDNNPTKPNIMTMDEAVGLYLDPSIWWQYGTDYGAIGAGGYRSFALFTPYELAVDRFNLATLTNKTQQSGGYELEWKLGVFPRLLKQRRMPFFTSSTNNNERLYEGEWSLDLVLFPTREGRCDNMVGKVEISYMSS